MPIASLDQATEGKYIHQPAHDLESLLQTIMAIVCFNDGACGEARPALDRVPTSRWFNEVDRDQLHKDKTMDFLYYKRDILASVTEYWQPFSPFLARLINATWPDMLKLPLECSPTHKEYITILKEALQAMRKLDDPLAPYADIKLSQGQKRSRPSEDDSRYPYPSKYSRSNDPNCPRLPRSAIIKGFTSWKDSVDA